MLFIPEPDLYRLAFGSRLPTAEKITDWVVEEVIPSIRATGSYNVPNITRLSLPEGVSLSGLARPISITRRAMLDAGSTPLDVCGMIKETYEAVGFPVLSVFPKQLPGQTCLFDTPALT